MNENLHGMLKVIARLQQYVSQFEFLVMALAVISGIVFLMVGLRRASFRAELGPGQGNWAACISWILAGIVLISLPGFMATLSQTVFATPVQESVTNVTALAPDLVSLFTREMGLQTIEGILQVVQLVGLIAVVRGVFILNSAIQPGSAAGIGAGLTHLVGGIAAWNIVLFMEVLNALFA